MPHIDLLLLLALPASGKSEVRRYLEHLPPEALRTDMHLGPTVQLDDYPYVHLMRRISQELRALDQEPVFFESDESSWMEPLDWLTLIHLLNEDHAALETGRATPTAADVIDRIDAARRTAGAASLVEALGPNRREIEQRLASDVAAVPALDRAAEGSTTIIEFARGGPASSSLPLPHPLGYRASLAALSPQILERAAVLYVWVEPAESRRRNRERAHPDGDASILHHGVPEAVMLNEYGLDDMAWLESQARRPHTIPAGEHDLPMARFDNRSDRTSFLRSDPDRWAPEDVDRLHADLAATLSLISGG